MVYVMSDLHGRYDKYLSMLEYIHFGDGDELYILGDLCDRGPQSAQLYLDVMKRPNVHCLMGNHESMLLEALPNAFGFLQNVGYAATLDLDVWSACGGGRTCASFFEVGLDRVREVYDYVNTLPWYREIEVEGGICWFMPAWRGTIVAARWKTIVRRSWCGTPWIITARITLWYTIASWWGIPPLFYCIPNGRPPSFTEAAT